MCRPVFKSTACSLSAIAASTATLLVATREHSPGTRVLVAGSGAMLGAAPESPRREDTPFPWPKTPYATARLAAHQLVGQLRDHDSLFACSGILYNTESERRPESFVSRKITRGAAPIKLGLAQELILGDLAAVRGWSFAGDIMHGAWLMLQQQRPADDILASGVPDTVGEFADSAFTRLGLNLQAHVRVDPDLKRAPEATPQVGDATRARTELGWQPTLGFEQLVGRMVDADLNEQRLHALTSACSSRHAARSG